MTDREGASKFFRQNPEPGKRGAEEKKEKADHLQRSEQLLKEQEEKKVLSPFESAWSFLRVTDFVFLFFILTGFSLSLSASACEGKGMASSLTCV